MSFDPTKYMINDDSYWENQGIRNKKIRLISQLLDNKRISLTEPPFLFSAINQSINQSSIKSPISHLSRAFLVRTWNIVSSLHYFKCYVLVHALKIYKHSWSLEGKPSTENIPLLLNNNNKWWLNHDQDAITDKVILKIQMD